MGISDTGLHLTVRNVLQQIEDQPYNVAAVVDDLVERLSQMKFENASKALIPKVFLSFIEKGAPWKLFADAIILIPEALTDDQDKNNEWLNSALLECLESMNLAPILNPEIHYNVGCFFGHLYFADILSVEGFKCLRLSVSNLQRQPKPFFIGFFTYAKDIHDEMVLPLKDFFCGSSSADIALWDSFVTSLNDSFDVNSEIKETLREHLVLAQQRVRN